MDDPESSPIDLAPKPRRRFRFGLRGLIVLVTLAAIVFAPLGMIARREQREQRAIDSLTALGAELRLNRANTRFEALRRYFCGNPWQVRFGLGFALTHDETWAPLPELAIVYFPMPNRSEFPDLTFESIEAFTADPGITDENMPEIVNALRSMSRIQRLSIESQVLTDDGLVQLCDAPEVSELDLRCPLVTSRSTDALQQKFPKLVIVDD